MSGGTSSSSSRQKDVTPVEYKAERPFTAEFFRGYQGGDFGQPLYTPITSGETAALGRVGDVGRNPFGQGETRESLLSTVRGDSPQFQGALEDAIAAGQIDIRRFAEDENLENRALFNRSGQVLSESSPFAQAQARSNQGVLDAVSKLNADIRLPAMLQERQNQLQAAGMLSDMGQQDFDRELQVLQAEGLPRLIQEHGLERGLALFKEQQDRILQARSVLAQLTAPTLSTRSKSSSAQGGICWVADVLYGKDSPRAVYARRWAKAHPENLFIRVYARFGEAWARFLERNTWAQPIVRPIWDAMAKAGLSMERV